jgi:hypothetical protein
MVEEELLSFLQDLGIETTDWKEGTPELTMLKLEALTYWTLIQQNRQNARNSVNQFSSGSALSELANSHFNNQRRDAQFAEGIIVVTGSSAVVPRTFQAAECKVTDGTYIFYNLSQFTISNAIPFVSTSFRADGNGAEYNIATNSDLTTVGTEVGFTITNPPYSFGISGSWLTTLGSDEESDNTLRQRNASTFASFQTGDLTIDRVKRMVFSASSDIEYVSINDNNPNGPGSANVYIATATTTTPSASVTAVQSVLNTSFFGNATQQRIVAYAATPYTFNTPFSIYYSKTVRATDLITSIETVANNWVASIPIGGFNYEPYGNNIIHINDLVTLINDVEGVERVIVSGSISELSVNTNQKLIAPTDWNDVFTYLPLSLR